MADLNQLSALKEAVGKSSSEFQSRENNRNTIVSLKVFIIMIYNYIYIL